MPWIKYIGPYDRVDVPLAGLRVDREVPVEVPEVVAGRDAGDWRRLEDGEAAPAGWPTRLVVDDAGHPVFGGDGLQAADTRDPGEGLLAQDCWVPADPPPPPAAGDSKMARASRASTSSGAQDAPAATPEG